MAGHTLTTGHMKNVQIDHAWNPAAAKDWYRSSYPDSGDDVVSVDDRCWAVIGHLGRIHDLTRHWLPGGGLTRHGNGLSLIVFSELATYDAAELTDMVVAAHALCCRVAIHGVILAAAPVEYDDEDAVAMTLDEWSARGYFLGDTFTDSLVAMCRTCHDHIHRVDTMSDWEHEANRFCDKTIPALPEITIGPFAAMEITVHPRSVEGESSYDRHPGTRELVASLSRIG